MIKICSVCKKEFWAHHTSNKYCSQKCAHEQIKKKTTLICLICKKEFEIKECLKDVRKTCSRECQAKYLSIIHKGIKLWKYRNPAETVNFRCLYCEEVTEIKKCRLKLEEGVFCSRDCSNKFNKKFGEENSNWQGGKSFEPYNPEFNELLKEKIRDKFDRKCLECGFSEKELNYKLRIHHVDYDKKNTLEINLVPLCKTCHSQTNFKRSDWMNYFREKLAAS